MKDSANNDLKVGCKLRSTKYTPNEVICLGLIPSWVILIQNIPDAFPWLLSESDMLKSQWKIYEYSNDEN